MQIQNHMARELCLFKLKMTERRNEQLGEKKIPYSLTFFFKFFSSVICIAVFSIHSESTTVELDNTLSKLLFAKL